MISAYAVDITVSSNGNYSIWGFVNPEAVYTKVFNLAGAPAGSDNAINMENTTSIIFNELNFLGNNLLLFYQTFNTTFEISFISNFKETGQMYSFDVAQDRNISGIIVSQDIDLAGGIRTKAKISGNSQSI